jgi:hypothetical protein
MGGSNENRAVIRRSHSRLAPLNLLASCSPSVLGVWERDVWEEGGLRRPRDGGSGREDSTAVGQGRLGGRSPLS